MAKRKFLCAVMLMFMKKISALKTFVGIQLSLNEEHSSSAETSQNTNFWLTC